jgi:hypothetical protein
MAWHMRSIVRRFIYNRWFYALLAAVCLLDAVCDTFDIASPGGYPMLDVISLVTSLFAAILTLLIFIDLQRRRN